MLRRATVWRGALAMFTGTLLGSLRDGAIAQQRWFITPDERAASAKASELPRAGKGITADDVTGSDPVVEIVLPREGEKIISPVDFDVRFRTSPPAVIDPTSVRVLYGFMRVDITSRIKEFGGEISAQGIKLVKAPLQPDSYTVTVEVANSQNRKARRTVRFNVS
ncbi:MAG: hypothetical protein BGN99_28160 [Alphaproteobacteria bacterium 65-37]|nr:MAG: hypothetical protein BGN99_28160 [Alphaproteobacteria bacterium 65-37]